MGTGLALSKSGARHEGFASLGLRTPEFSGAALQLRRIISSGVTPYSSPTLRFSLRFRRLRLFLSHFQRMRPFFFHFLGLDPNKSPNEKYPFASGIFILQYL